MLVLSRRNDQAVVVGGVDRPENTLRVIVLEIRDGSVRLGFETKVEVPIHREEVWSQIVAGRVRETPTRQSRATQSSGADGSADVLSRAGQGRGPKSVRE
jgi:carbon storage regulator CsrA